MIRICCQTSYLQVFSAHRHTQWRPYGSGNEPCTTAPSSKGVEQKKLDSKEYVLYDSISIKLENRQNESLLLGVRENLPLKSRCDRMGSVQRTLAVGDDLFLNLGAGYTAVLSLCKFIRLHTCDARASLNIRDTSIKSKTKISHAEF